MASKCSNTHSPVQLIHHLQFLKQIYHFSFLVILSLFNSMHARTHTHIYITLSRHNSNTRACTSHDHSTPHGHSSMTINKHEIYTTYHEGFHNNSCKNRWNHNVQTHKWDDLLCTGISVVFKYIEMLWPWNMQVSKVCNPVQSDISRNPKLHLNLSFILEQERSSWSIIQYKHQKCLLGLIAQMILCLENGNFDTVLLVEESKMLGTSDKVYNISPR